MSEEIRLAVGVLAPTEGVVEVRALADGVTHSGYFDDHEALARAVEALDADPSVAGIYVTLNTVNPALLARRANRIKLRLSRKDATTADADILRRRWLPVDIDPVRPSGVSSTDAEHDAALAAAERIATYLTEQGFPVPVRADSGNGAHLLYRIDLANDAEATALIKGCLATLDALFSNEAVTVDTANHNAARIWKLYGTMSRKGDSTPARPHRRARLLAVPDEVSVVPGERLRHLAGLLPREEPPQRKNGPGIDLAAWLLDHGIAVRSTRPWQGGPSTPSRTARSRRRIKTGPSPSSSRTAPSSPAATTRPAAGERSAGRNSGGCTSQRNRRQRRSGRRHPPLPRHQWGMSTASVPLRSSGMATPSRSFSKPSIGSTSATEPSRSAW